MAVESFTCELITWDQSYQLAKTLAKSVKSSGYRPDLVIAIGRGGYVPARVVCDVLLLNMLTSIKIEHWGPAGQKKDQVVIRFPLVADVKGQKILIIDDITDTGDTLEFAVKYIESFGPSEVKTGVLQHKDVSTFQPDFFVEKIAQWRWVTYPWALHEDLVGFVGKIVSEKSAPFEAIKKELIKKYQIVVSDEDIQDALDDLIYLGEAEKSGPIYRKL